MDENNNIDENMFNPLVMSNNSCKKYTATDLKKPVSSPLRTVHHSDVTSKEKDQARSSTGNTVNKTVDELLSSKKNKPPQAADRRRPTVQVKALTSSEVSEKYNLLLNKRLEVVDYTKKRLAQELEPSEEKHKKEMELMEVQILNEKERLKKLKRNDY